MSTKHFVLEVLEKNRDKNISGEYIADLLNVSRNMIWRAIKDLRNDGYAIEAITNKGYRLEGKNDIISAEGIKPFLTSPDWAQRINIYAQIDSTNREAKAQAIHKAPHGTVIIANTQTSGKGRYDRNFFSPSGSGLYMSFVLHPDDMRFANPTSITAYAALCVCDAIENVCGMKPSIKWVNDIFLDGKKICGILTETIIEFESRRIEDIILGIGVNICTKPEEFPATLRPHAGSLYPDGNAPITRNRLAAEIINHVLRPDLPTETQLFERYKTRLFMLGADITVIQNREKHPAKALDINSQGNLIVQMQNGDIKTISSGEIIMF